MDTTTVQNMETVQHAFTNDARRLATEIYRVYAHPAGYDLGAARDLGAATDDAAVSFLMQVWAAKRGAATAYRIRALAAGADAAEATATLAASSDEAAICHAHFIAFATEAVVDAWDGETPLPAKKVGDIAIRAMVHAWKMLYMLE